MNLFYHDVTRDQSKLKPAKLEQGEVRPRAHTGLLHGQRSSASWDGFDVCVVAFALQVCAVYCADKSSWCRAQVETVSMDSECYRARCFLVDHGERVFVSSDK